MKKIALVISCEHAVNTIPLNYQPFFAEHKDAVNGPRGFDPGAMDIAGYLSQSLNTSLTSSFVNRLLIDCNRSLDAPGCFSEVSSQFTEEERQRLIRNYYAPFRQHLEHNVQDNIGKGCQVWHLSIHSFAPFCKGEIRDADIGLLFDPARKQEQTLAEKWQILLNDHTDFNDIRLNYPHQDLADGITRDFRCKFPEEDYLGIEIACNQSITGEPRLLTRIIHGLDLTLKILQA